MYIEFDINTLVDQRDISGMKYSAYANETYVFTSDSQVPFITVRGRQAYDVYKQLLELQKALLPINTINLDNFKKLMDFHYATPGTKNDIIELVDKADEMIAKAKANKEATQMDLFPTDDTQILN